MCTLGASVIAVSRLPVNRLSRFGDDARIHDRQSTLPKSHQSEIRKRKAFSTFGGTNRTHRLTTKVELVLNHRRITTTAEGHSCECHRQRDELCLPDEK